MTTYRFTYELVVESCCEAEAIWQVSEMYNDDFREVINLIRVEEIDVEEVEE